MKLKVQKKSQKKKPLKVEMLGTLQAHSKIKNKSDESNRKTTKYKKKYSSIQPQQTNKQRTNTKNNKPTQIKPTQIKPTQIKPTQIKPTTNNKPIQKTMNQQQQNNIKQQQQQHKTTTK